MLSITTFIIIIMCHHHHHLEAWKAGERLLHAQPHCVYGTICNGIMAVRQEVRRLGRSRPRLLKAQKACRAGLCIHVSMRGRTGERLQYTQPHREYGTIRNGNVAVGQELRAGSAFDKGRTGSMCTRDGITVLLELCVRLNR